MEVLTYCSSFGAAAGVVFRRLKRPLYLCHVLEYISRTHSSLELQSTRVHRMYQSHLHAPPLSVFIFLDLDVDRDFVEHRYRDILRPDRR